MINFQFDIPQNQEIFITIYLYQHSHSYQYSYKPHIPVPAPAPAPAPTITPSYLRTQNFPAPALGNRGVYLFGMQKLSYFLIYKSLFYIILIIIKIYSRQIYSKYSKCY